jgi:hypothetical protein
VSLYGQRLATLKHEISQEIKRRKKHKKKFTKNQLIMINFINGVTKDAVFIIKDMEVTIKKGDDKKGFKHILQKHYCKGCDGELTTRDILNFDLFLQRAIKLHSEGVTNTKLEVYQYIKGLENYKIVLKKERDNRFVVTYYSVDR